MTSRNGMYGRTNVRRQQPAVSAYEAFSQRRRARRGYKFDDVVHVDNLIRVFRRLKREAGQASGPDGVRFKELSNRDVARWMRQLSVEVQDGTFRVGGKRDIQIEKPDGDFRTIRIRRLQFRVLAAALQEALDPIIDPVFLGHSYGFRKKQNVWKLIARLLHDVERYGLWCVVQDDVRKAFDNVDVEQLLQDMRKHTQCSRTLALLETMLKAELECDANWDGIGIDQGNAISPMCLNVRLHWLHDRIIEADERVPSWYRYADNVLYAARDVREGQEALRRVRQLFSPSEFELKGGPEGEIVNLRAGEVLHTLGFSIQWTQTGWEIDPCKDTWDALRESFTEAHRTDTPSSNAVAALRGWIAFNGPVFTERSASELVPRILTTAAQLGFREIGTHSEIASWMQDAHASWLEVMHVASSL